MNGLVFHPIEMFLYQGVRSMYDNSRLLTLRNRILATRIYLSTYAPDANVLGPKVKP